MLFAKEQSEKNNYRIMTPKKSSIKLLAQMNFRQTLKQIGDTNGC